MAFSGLPQTSALKFFDLTVDPISIVFLRPIAGDRINMNRKQRIEWTDSILTNTQWTVRYKIGAGAFVLIGVVTTKYIDWTPPSWTSASTLTLEVVGAP